MHKKSQALPNMKIAEIVKEFRSKNEKAFRQVKTDDFLFSIFCANYLFFSKGERLFDAESFVQDNYVDGHSDGGVDSIFVNPSDQSEIVIIQAKYYTKSKYEVGEFKKELNKIRDTVKGLREGQNKGFRPELTSAYSSVSEGMGETPRTRVVVCIANDFQKSTARSFIDECVKRSSEDLTFEIRFLTDILDCVRDVDAELPYAPKGELVLDVANNILRYGENAAIVNVSGLSLQKLYNQYGREALGMNLRYHVDNNRQNKDVDKGLAGTLRDEPEKFWFRNNGILIVCKSFSFSGRTLSFEHFSIVNGGQTSFVLSRENMSPKCFLQCKIAAVVNDIKNGEDPFVDSIARATNSQKPIKPSDLKSNEKSQIELKKALKNLGVFYSLKGGDRTNPDKLPRVSLDEIGNIAVASVLLAPGSVRSLGTKMFYDNPDNYNYIFEDPNADFLADMFFATKAFKEFKQLVFRNRESGEFDEQLVMPMIANGSRHFIACLAYMAKLRGKVFSAQEFLRVKNDDEGARKVLRRMGSLKNVFLKTLSSSEKGEVLEDIFRNLAEDVFGFCAGVASSAAENGGNVKKFIPSNYLKGDKSFYSAILPRLQSRYAAKGSVLKSLVDKIMM